MLLSALPKGVKGDLIVYWVQGVHQILYRLMAIFQPGGVQDRAQILRQMDVSESGAADSEVVPPLAESIVPRSDVAGRVAAGEVSLDGCAEDLGAEPRLQFQACPCPNRTSNRQEAKPGECVEVHATLVGRACTGRKSSATASRNGTATSTSTATTPAATLKGVQNA